MHVVHITIHANMHMSVDALMHVWELRVSVTCNWYNWYITGM